MDPPDIGKAWIVNDASKLGGTPYPLVLAAGVPPVAVFAFCNV
jgi:hypothetical protein